MEVRYPERGALDLWMAPPHRYSGAMGRAEIGVAAAFAYQVVRELDTVRTKRGMTHAALLEHLSISRNYYYKRLRGELPLNLNDVAEIASALGTTPSVVLTRAERAVKASGLGLSDVRGPVDTDADGLPLAALDRPGFEAQQETEQHD
jgi:transcriptional regulator with XRE-family HTH domain